MRDHIKKRNNFKDIDINEVAYIPYAPYKEFPTRYDYKDGEKKTIVLLNKLTGELEEIEFKYDGAVPLPHENGYMWYWGEVKTNDYNASIVFYFFRDGSFKEAAVTLCGRSPNREEFKKMKRGIKYPAQITARYF